MTYRTFTASSGLHAGVWEPEGEAAGTIVAIHGITSSHRTWAPLSRAMSSWRIVAPDLRGRGRSSGMPGPYGMARHADDVAGLLAELGIDHVLPIGHSMGGFVSVVLTRRHPQLMDRLIIVDGGIPLPAPEGISREEAVDAALGPAAKRLSMTFESPEQYVEFWRQHPAFARWTDDIDAYARYDLEGEAPELHPATSYEAMAADYRDLTNTENNELLLALRDLSIPTIFLRAQRGMLDEPGGMLPADHVAQWLPYLPTVEVREVDANHYTIALSDAGAAAIADAVTTVPEADREPATAGPIHQETR